MLNPETSVDAPPSRGVTVATEYVGSRRCRMPLRAAGRGAGSRSGPGLPAASREDLCCALVRSGGELCAPAGARDPAVTDARRPRDGCSVSADGGSPSAASSSVAKASRAGEVSPGGPDWLAESSGPGGWAAAFAGAVSAGVRRGRRWAEDASDASDMAVGVPGLAGVTIPDEGWLATARKSCDSRGWGARSQAADVPSPARRSRASPSPAHRSRASPSPAHRSRASTPTALLR